MAFRTAKAARIAVMAAMVGVAAQAVQVHAAEGSFLEMLFGVHPAPSAPAAAPVASRLPVLERAVRRDRLGSGRHKLRTRYAALPVRIHVSERQTPQALLKDETLRPGDIVVFKSGAQVFAGNTGRSHTMGDFKPVGRTALLDKKTRTLLVAMTQPAGALPAQEARRMVARLRETAQTPPASVVARSAEIRVISPWRTAP